MKNNKLISSGLIFVMGTLLLRGINFFTLPIFTRLMMPEDYAAFSLYSSTVGVITLFLGLQIQGSINLVFSHKDIERFNSYVANITTVPIIGLIMGFLLTLCIPNIGAIFQLESNFYFGAVLIQASMGIIIAMYTVEMIIKQQPKKHLLFSVLMTMLNVILSVLFISIMKENTYFARVSAGIIATAILFSIIYYRYIKFIDFKYMKSDILEGLKLSLPLIFHGLGTQILNVADRFMLSAFSTEFDVAIYSFTYNLGLIIQMLWSSFNNAWVPWYFENLKAKKTREVKNASVQYLILFTVITIGFLLATPELVAIMGGEQYRKGIEILPLIVMAYYFVFLYGFYVNYEFYQKQTKLIPVATTIAAILNIVLNIFMIPKYGYYGASVSTLISYFAMLVFHYGVVRFKMKHQDFPDYYLFTAIGINMLFLCGLYLILDAFFIRLALGIILLVVYGSYLYLFVVKKSLLKK